MLPTELTLRTTREGVRLFSMPVAELEQLFTTAGKWEALTSDVANRRMEKFRNAGCLRLTTTIELSHATDATLTLDGQRIIAYDLNANTLNGRFYAPEQPTDMRLRADVYIDRTSVEVFIDGGRYSYSLERRAEPGNDEGFRFHGNRIRIVELEVFSVDSIW